MAFESLAAFYHDMLPGNKLSTGRESNDYAVFKGIFQDLHTNGAEPLDLYVQGVRKYLTIKGLK